MPAAIDPKRPKQQVTDAWLKELAGLKSLQTLGLSFTSVTDVGLKEVAKLKQLQSLYLGNTKVSDTGLKELAGLTELHNAAKPPKESV